MNFTRNFTLEELIASKIVPDNSPTIEVEEKLNLLAIYILQPIRDKWGKIEITSGFRGQRLNRAVGGADTSQHLLGEAADIIPLDADIDEVYKWIVTESGLKFGQAINERKGSKRWIHVSLPRLSKPNQQAFVYNGAGYTEYM